MKIAALLPAFLALSAAAASDPWRELSVGDAVALTQTLELEGKSGGSIRVLEGAEYVVDSIEPLDGLSVVDFILVAKRCRHPRLESALTLVLPAESPPNSKAEVGVYHLRDCALEVMVEFRDYAEFSFFRK